MEQESGRSVRPAPSAGQSVIDSLWRSAYRAAYRVARVWWRWRRPNTASAMIALWHRDRLLLVHSSYRRGWALPGGGIRAGESPAAAARREAREELGLEFDPSLFSRPVVFEDNFEYRCDRMHVFEVLVAEQLSPMIDRREIICYRLFSAEECRGGSILSHVRRYLAARSTHRK